MSWKDSKNIGDIVDNTDWNHQATEIIRISGSYANHSGNTDIHFPSSQLTNWLDNIYSPSGSIKINTGWSSVSDGGTIPHGLGSKPSYVNVVPSGNNEKYGIAFSADSTNITVNFTIDGTKDVNWIVEV